MMCFCGGGIGHKSTRQATDFFKNDRNTLDLPNLLEPTSDIEEEINEESEEIKKTSCSDVADEEDDYGYQLGEDQSDDELDDNELRDEDFGPENDGRAVDPDMEELGYADL